MLRRPHVENPTRSRPKAHSYPLRAKLFLRSDQLTVLNLDVANIIG
jgi:hypothetical protein